MGLFSRQMLHHIFNASSDFFARVENIVRVENFLRFFENLEHFGRENLAEVRGADNAVAMLCRDGAFVLANKVINILR
jgi:hypothetical protein